MYRLSFLYFFFILSGNQLKADLSDHFKKAENKIDEARMKNIDFIYMINLDERPGKFQITKEKFAQYGITPYRFSAVNGWRLTLDQINDIGVKYGWWLDGGKVNTYYPLDGDGTPQHEPMLKPGRTYFCHCMSRGAIGIVLSHLSILQDAYDSGYETIWVLEDDVNIVKDPHTLSDRIEELDRLVGKDGWDILFTDKDTQNKLGQYIPSTAHAWRPNFKPNDPDRFAIRTDLNETFRQVGARFGAYSMIVRRSGMEKLLDFFKNYSVFLPFDIDYTFPEKIKLITLIDDVVIPWNDAPTDNGAPNFEKELF